MSFADTLDPTKPADGDLLSQGDDSVRTLARAIQQRLASAFGDIDADPIKLAGTAYADNTIPASAIQTSAGLRQIVFGSVLISSLSIAAGGTASGTATISGIDTSDLVLVNDGGNSAMRQCIVRAYVSGTDTVRVDVTNTSDTAVGPVAGTVTVAIIKAP